MKELPRQPSEPSASLLNRWLDYHEHEAKPPPGAHVGTTHEPTDNPASAKREAEAAPGSHAKQNRHGLLIQAALFVGDGDGERDRKGDEREAALDRREQALDETLAKAEEILAAADQRDAVSDARDLRSDSRDDAIDRARSLTDGYNNPNAPGRRAASLDRQHAKNDRAASKEDRAALTESHNDPEGP